MNSNRLLPLLIAIALSTACRTGPDLRHDLDRLVLDESMVTAADQMPAGMPILVSVELDSAVEFSQRLQSMLPAFLTLAVGESLAGAGVNRLLNSEGLDKTRPLLVGMLAPLPDEETDRIIHGNILDATEIPKATHIRAIVPALDADQLRASLVELSVAHGGEESPQGLILMPSMLSAASMRAADQSIVIDVAIGTFALEDAIAALPKFTALPGSKRARTPAANHFLEGDAALALHVEMGGLLKMAALQGTIQMGQALSNVPAITREQLMSMGTSLILKTALIGNVLDRNIHDFTLSLNTGADLEVVLTRTTTPAAAAAQAEGERLAGRIYAPLGDPILHATVGLNIRKLGETRGPFASAGGELTTAAQLDALLQDGGLMTKLYFLMNRPALATGGIADLAGKPLYKMLPESLTVVLNKLTRDSAGLTSVEMAIVADFPAGDLPPVYQKLLEESETDLNARFPGHSINIDTVKEENHTQLRLGIGASAEALIDLSKPAPPSRGLNLDVDLMRLEDLFMAIDGPPKSILKAVIAGISPLEVRSASGPNTLTTKMRIGARNAGALEARAYAGEAVEYGHGPGQQCLIDATKDLAYALAARSQIAPDAHKRFFDAVEEEVKTNLICAKKDARTAEFAKTVDSGLHLYLAKQNQTSGDQDSALDHARVACEQDRRAACVLLESLTPPWPDGALRYATPDWPDLPRAMNIEHELAVTKEGVYMDKERLGDLERARGAGQGAYPWVVEALRKSAGNSTEPRGTAILLTFDADTLGPVSRRMWISAAASGFQRAFIRIKSPSGKMKSEEIFFAEDDSDSPPSEEDGVEVGTLDILIRSDVRLSARGGTTATFPLDDALPLNVAQWVAENGLKLGFADTAYVRNHSDLKWSALLNVLSPIKIPWSRRPSDMDELRSGIENHRPQFRRDKLVFVFDKRSK